MFANALLLCLIVTAFPETVGRDNDKQIYSSTFIDGRHDVISLQGSWENKISYPYTDSPLLSLGEYVDNTDDVQPERHLRQEPMQDYSEYPVST
jgi:hypothetical protein